MTRSRCLNKAQSLIELSVFSSLMIMAMGVLVSYGLSYNHNQRLQMNAFRKAMQLAEQEGGQNNSLTASITLVYDRALASPASMFGLAERRPMSFNYSGTRSNHLQGELEGYDSELPRIVYDINGKIYTFTTADFIYKKFEPARRKAPIEGWNGRGRSWHWEYPSSRNRLGDNTTWDIDADDKEETIISTHLTYRLRDGREVSEAELSRLYQAYVSDSRRRNIEPLDFNAWKSQNVIDTARYGRVMDSQEGELDLTEDDLEIRNGLISEGSTAVVSSNTLENTQDRRVFTTSTTRNQAEIIERRIRLNPQATSLSNVHRQIQSNNGNCYGRGSSCLAAERDEYRVENGQKFLIVRSRFSQSGRDYEWRTQN